MFHYAIYCGQSFINHCRKNGSAAQRILYSDNNLCVLCACDGDRTFNVWLKFVFYAQAVCLGSSFNRAIKMRIILQIHSYLPLIDEELLA